jgi:hypothetical protein
LRPTEVSGPRDQDRGGALAGESDLRLNFERLVGASTVGLEGYPQTAGISDAAEL